MDFIQAEKIFEQIKAQFSAGTLSESEFKSKLEELMLQDGQGSWWMIGYETEKWYRHNGKDWVQTDPPGNISQISTHKPLKQEIGVKTPPTILDNQKSFWKLGKKEIIQSVIGLSVFTLLYFLFGRKSTVFTFRSWPPAFAVPLFFGLVFGPMVGVIVDAGRYIIDTVFMFYQYGYYSSGMSFWALFSNVGVIAFALEGFIMGIAKVPSKNYRSLNGILRTELFVILAILARFLLATNPGAVFSSSDPDSLMIMLKMNLLFPLFGSLIIVPICAIVYSLILSRRKVKA